MNRLVLWSLAASVASFRLPRAEFLVHLPVRKGDKGVGGCGKAVGSAPPDSAAFCAIDAVKSGAEAVRVLESLKEQVGC